VAIVHEAVLVPLYRVISRPIGLGLAQMPKPRHSLRLWPSLSHRTMFVFGPRLTPRLWPL